jgi:hypothetical protein
MRLPSGRAATTPSALARSTCICPIPKKGFERIKVKGKKNTNFQIPSLRGENFVRIIPALLKPSFFCRFD